MFDPNQPVTPMAQLAVQQTMHGIGAAQPRLPAPPQQGGLATPRREGFNFAGLKQAIPQLMAARFSRVDPGKDPIKQMIVAAMLRKFGGQG